MWLLVTYISIWAVSPGPVCVKTIQEARKHGSRAGVTIAMGASITAILMVIAGLVIHETELSKILDSSGVFVIEQVGAIGIILMGVYAGFKCMTATIDYGQEGEEQVATRAGLIQGMGVMAAGIPHALLFYNVIIPQTVELSDVTSTIIGLGGLKVMMIFGFHALVAIITGRSQQLVRNNRFKKIFDFSSDGHQLR